MKACLIIPPSIFLLDERVFVNLGVLKIAAVLEQAGQPVEVLDLSGVSNFEDVVELHAKNTDASWFGVTTTTPQMPATAKIARRIASARPDARLCIGGPHPTLIGAALKREMKLNIVGGRATKAMEQLHELFDVVVSGDGEDAIFEALVGESSFIDADDPKGPLFMTNKRYEQTPMPARHLIDLSSYHYTIEGKSSTSLIAQLGCLVAGTMIKRADGTEASIETLVAGDMLMCYNDSTHELNVGPVAKAWSRWADDTWQLVFDDGTELFITSEHPVWTGSEWKRVEQIEEGDEITALSAVRQDSRVRTSTLSEVAREATFVQRRVIRKQFVGRRRVYNITVCPGHSYVANCKVVHNCPFQCTFCGGRESAMLRRIRTRSTQSILTELEHLHTTYGYTGFMFYDDELNVNKSLVELMDGITDIQMRLGVEFRLRGFVKSELFTEAQAQAMQRAGFRWLLTGFESGSPRILENIKKQATREENTRCFDIARSNGLKVKALMSIGHAGESEETCRDTQDWLMQVRPDDFDVTIITTYPGTPYYDHAVETSPNIWTYTAPKSGDRLHAVALDYNETADYYKGDPDGGYQAYVFTDYMTSEQLVTVRGEIESSVRTKFDIPFNPGAAAQNFEHSMGQTSLPTTILRQSIEAKKKSMKLPVIQ